MLVIVNILFKISFFRFVVQTIAWPNLPLLLDHFGDLMTIAAPEGWHEKSWNCTKITNGLFHVDTALPKIKYCLLHPSTILTKKSNKNDLFSHSGAAPTTFVIMGRWTILCLAPSPQNGRKRRYFFTQGTCSDNNDCALPGYHICVPNCLERWPF